MAAFVLKPTQDNYSGLGGQFNLFYFTPSTLQSTDVITGGATSFYIDAGILTAGGTVSASQFSNVSGLEELRLSDSGNNVTLTDALVAGSSTGYFTVSDGAGGDWGLLNAADADGDGRADLLWRKSDGTTALAANSQISSSINDSIGSSWYPIDNSWHLIGRPDTDGDGKADAIWRGDNGQVAIWHVDGTAVTGAAIAGSIGSEWQFVTTADVNGDNKADILWESNGTLVVWQLNGTQVQSAAVVGSMGPQAHLLGSADVSGDHKSDVVWRDDSGAVTVWQLNGAQIQASAVVGSIGAEWQFSGFADFNRDGRQDMLWQRGDGTVAVFLMNGTQAPAAAIVGSIGTDWHVIGTADFDGDGRGDILWRNDAGTVAVWGMNGAEVAYSGIVSALGTDWHLVSTADFNGDHNADLLWRNDDGSLVIWNMSGSQVIGANLIPANGSDTIDATAVTAGHGVHAFISTGNDTYTGGAGDDTVYIVSPQLNGADTISGGAGGTDALVVNNANALIAASQFANVSEFEVFQLVAGGTAHFNNTLSTTGLRAIGSAAVDTFDGAGVTGYTLRLEGHGGADTLTGGALADQIVIPDSNFAAIEGGGGDDRLVLATPGQSFSLTANATKIHNTEVLWLADAAGTVVTLQGADIPQVSAATNYLYVVGGSDDDVTAGAGWTLMNTAVVNNAIAAGFTFNQYHHTNGSELFVSDQITLSISASADNPPVIELQGTLQGNNFNTTYTTGDTNGVAIGDTDAALSDPDPSGVNSRLDHLTATLTNANSNDATTREFLVLTAAGHTEAAANGITIVGEGTAALTLQAAAHSQVTDAIFQDLLRDIRYVNTDTRPGQDYSDRIIHVDAQDQGGASATQRTATIDLTKGNSAPVAVDDAASATEASGTANGTPGTDPAGNNVITGVGTGSVADSDFETPTNLLTVVAVHTGPEGGSTGAGTVNSGLAGSYGTLTLHDDGSYTYEVDNTNPLVDALDPSGVLVDIFNYTIQDGGGLQDTATLTVTIHGADDAPVAVADSATVAEDSGATTIDVLANDTDIDSGTKLIIGTTNGAHGTVAITGGGSDLTYTPDADYNNTTGTPDTFTYTISGGATATVSVTVNAVNDAPTASNLTRSFTIDEDAAPAALFSAPSVDDIDSPNVTATLTLTNAAAGVLTGGGFAATPTAGQYSFTGSPTDVTSALAAVQFDSADNFNGTATIQVAIDDGPTPGPQGPNPTGTVTITVNAVNDAPSFTIADPPASDEDAGAVSISSFATSISAGPPDEAGQAVSFVVTGNTNSALFAVGGGPEIAADGTLTYTAAANANGTATITVHAHDDGGTPPGADNSGDQIFIITVNSVNDEPTTADNTVIAVKNSFHVFTVTEFNFSDPNDTPANNLANVIITSAPNAGELSVNGTPITTFPAVVSAADIAAGNFRFTPTTGTDGVPYTSFSFQVQDNGGTTPGDDTSAAATMNISVPPNNPPVAHDDVASATEAGGNGNALAGTDASGNVITDAPGADTDIEDDAASVPLTVTAVGTLAEGNPDNGTVESPLQGSYGKLTLHSGGSYSYTVDQNNPTVQALQAGGATLSDVFHYTVTDTGGLSDSATLTVTISGQNDAPLTNDSTKSGSEDQGTPTPISVLLTASDPDGTITSYNITDLPTHGTLYTDAALNNAVAAPGVIAASGGQLQLFFKPNANYNGPDLFHYAAIDNSGLQDSTAATANITVDPVNDAPTASNLTRSFTINEDAAPAALFSAPSVADIDSASVTATLTLTNTAAGVLTGGGFAATPTAGQYSFTGSPTDVTAALAAVQFDSADNFNGSATVQVAIDDGPTPGPQGTNPTGTVTVTVNPVNDAPSFTIASPPPASDEDSGTRTVSGFASSISAGPPDEVAAGQTVTFNVTGDSNPALFAGGGGPAISPTGTLTYTAAPNAYGTATITVTLSDNGSNTAPNQNTSASQSFTITVNNVPDNPVAVDDTLSAVNEDSAPRVITTASLLTNDFDVDNQPQSNAGLSVTGVSNFHGGTAVLNGGNVTFTLTQDFNGTASFDYTVTDATGLTDIGTASYTVNAVNDAPVNSFNGSPTPTNLVVHSATPFAVNGLSIGDIDANEGGTATNITTTLQAGVGTVAIGNGVSGGNAGITNGATVATNGTGTVTLTGTLAQINTTLGNDHVFYTAPDTASASNAPNTTLTITTNDAGHTGIDPGLSGTATTEADVDVIAVGILPQVWFIDNTPPATTSGLRGSQTNPFTSITEFNNSSGPGVNDYIYIKDGTYTGDGINLKDGQTLLGDGEQLSFTDPFGGPAIIVDAGGGNRPIINVTTNLDQGIDLAQNNVVRGIDITTGAGTTGLDDGEGAAGNDVGALTISNMAISGAGSAVDIDHGGALSVQLDAVTSTGGAAGIQLAGAGLSGVFTAGTGANAATSSISGSTTAGLLVGDGAGTANTGGTVAITYGGAISATGAANVVNVQDHSSTLGLVTLSGNLTHTGAGSAIVLDDNASSFTFSGATNNLSTDTANAINITDQTGGTIQFFNAVNIATTTGTGVNLVGNTGGTINFIGGGNGLDITSTTGTGFNATGGGTISVGGVGNTVNSSLGTALNLANVTLGPNGVNFATTSSGGGARGINLDTVGGTSAIDLGTGTLSGHTASEIDINGGGQNITYGGTIGNGTGLSAEITGHTGGTITLSGNINDTNDAGGGIAASGNTGGTIIFSGTTKTLNTGASNGVDLSNNTGATINFTGGGLDIDTTSGTGFSATGTGVAPVPATKGGTITVQGSGNTIDSTSGTALKVVNTTIGDNDLTFQSISSGSGASSSDTGIILDNTGNANGGLHVTGNGGTVTPTGGIIQNKTGTDGQTATGVGIYLNNTFDVQLDHMALHDFGNFAIKGSTVNGFSLANSTISGSNGNNDTLDEGSISFTQLTGSAALTNDSISGGWEDNVKVVNTSGTLNRLTVDNVNFGANSASFGNSAMNIQVGGTGVLNMTVQNSHFNSSRSTSLQYTMNSVSGVGTASGDVQILNNTFSDDQTTQPQISGAAGIFLTSGGTGSNPTLTYNIGGNTVTGMVGSGITIGKGSGTGTFNGSIHDNTVGTLNVSGSGGANGISLVHVGGGTDTISITNNTIREFSGDGILLQVGDNTSGGNGNVFATVTGNVVKDAFDGVNAFPNAAFEGNFGTTAADAPVVHLTLGGAGALQNDFARSAGQSVAYVNDEVRLRERFNTVTHLPGYGGGATDDAAVANFVAGNNILTGNPTIASEAPHVTVSHGVNGATWVGTPLLAAAGGVDGSNGPSETHLTQSQLDTVAAAAIERWAAAGLSASQLNALHHVILDVADTAGVTLGSSTTGHITFDSDAGGYGWFVDPTPGDDAEFAHAVGASRLQTDPTEAPAGHIDLLTTVMHEMGHQLGLDDIYDGAARDDIMYGLLTTGERRMPDASDVAQAENAAAAQAAEAALPVSAQAPVGTPVVTGGAGNDVFDVSGGGTILVGGGGADSFVFAQSAATTVAPVTHIADYSALQGDTIDFSALVPSTDGIKGADAMLVRAHEDASGTFATLQVQADIAHSANWVDVAQLDGTHAGDAINVETGTAHALVQIHADWLV